MELRRTKAEAIAKEKDAEAALRKERARAESLVMSIDNWMK